MYSPMRRNTRKQQYTSAFDKQTNKQTKVFFRCKKRDRQNSQGESSCCLFTCCCLQTLSPALQKGPRNERIHLRTAEVTTSCCFKRLNIKLTFLLTTKSNEFPCQTRTHSSTRLFRFDGLRQAYKTSDTQNADCGVSTVSTSQRPAVIAAVRGHVIGYSWIDWQCQ